MRKIVTLALSAIIVVGFLGFTQQGHGVLSTLGSIAYYYRGAVYAAGGDKDGAIADYNEAIRLYPKSTDAYYSRGVAFAAKGDNDRAIADYSEAIRLDPTHNCAYYSRGAVFKAEGDNDRAIADYNKAIGAATIYAFAYIGRGAAYAAKGDNDRAIADYNWAIQLESKHTFGYTPGAAVRKAKEDYDGIWLHPKYAFSYIGRGLAYAAKGDNDRAIADYNMALRLDPKLGNAFSDRDRDDLFQSDLARAAADFCPAAPEDVLSRRA